MPTNQSQLTDEWIWKPALAAFLRNPFEGAGHIRKNYSQAFQDIFVLSILDGLKNGRYLEIGAQRPILNNNTYLLHKKYKWSGISIEIDPAHLFEWRKERPKCELIVADALKINYGEAFANWFRPTQASSFWTRSFRTQNNVIRDDNRIDYLQLDIDPSINTLRVCGCSLWTRIVSRLSHSRLTPILGICGRETKAATYCPARATS